MNSSDVPSNGRAGSVLALGPRANKSVKTELAIEFSVVNVILFFPIVRDIPFLFIGAWLLIAFGYLLVTNRIVIEAASFWMFVVATIYVPLSILHVLPSGWTQEYRQSYILRQYFEYPAFLVLVWLFVAICEKIRRSGIEQRFFMWMFIIGFIESFIIFVLIPAPNSPGPHGYLPGWLTLYGFTNSEAMLQFSFVAMVILGTRKRLSYIVTIIIFTFFLKAQQNIFVNIALIPLLFFRAKNTIFYSAIFVWAAIGLSLPVYMILAHYDPRFLYFLYPDAYVRAAFWRDAIQNIFQSHLIGVGYGTEYHHMGRGAQFVRQFNFNTTDHAMVMGNHNSFLDIAFRLGLPGFIALVSLFVKALPGKRLGERHLILEMVAWWIAFLAFFVNPGLESPTVFAVAAFLIGYLIAGRRIRQDNRLPARMAAPIASRT
jgi:hypothetical protein